MDGFSYHNIFDTKGIEYLIIIAFLILIIPFWIILNKKIPVRQKIRQTTGILSENILQIPFGLLFSRNHTWTFLTRSGIAEIGPDDFLLHVTGVVRFSILVNPGTLISRGDHIADINHNGRKLKILSPISGIIEETNDLIKSSSSSGMDESCRKGWICRITPTRWNEETSSLLLAEEAIRWSGRELQRFRDFLAVTVRKDSPELSLVLLQDGGELRDQPLAELPDEVWEGFQKSFLDLSD
jgi:glycine cleavage system H protein